MIIFLFLCAVLLKTQILVASHDDIDTTPHWQARCETQGEKFTLHFDSKAGSADEDDMGITACFDSSQVPIPLLPNWYHPLLKKILPLASSPKLPEIFLAFCLI